MIQHTRRAQTHHPNLITLSNATWLLSSASAILLISPTKSHTSLGFSGARRCVTLVGGCGEGGQANTVGIANTARSRGESTTVWYCLQNAARAKVWRRMQESGAEGGRRKRWTSGKKVRIKAAFLVSTSEKRIVCFSAERTITGRLHLLTAHSDLDRGSSDIF